MTAVFWTEVVEGARALNAPTTMPSAVDGQPHLVGVGDRILAITSDTGELSHSVVPAAAVNAFVPFPLPKYTEGSQACRNYSTLTKDLRVVAFQLLAGSAVGMALVYRGDSKDTFFALLGPVSLVLYLFAVALMCVNTHYAMAFLFIRDWLARAEKASGPWSAHQRARKGARDDVAYAMPFFVLALVAVLGMLLSGGEIWPAVGSVLSVASAFAGWRWFRWMALQATESKRG